MRIANILKGVLFIYESVRIIILAFTLVYQLPESSAIPWLAFTAPSVLFPIMALFLLLDTDRFRAYIPLYITGKCIGIFSLISWLIVSGQVTMIHGMAGFFVVAELIFLSGDMFALAVILIIRNLTEKKARADTAAPSADGTYMEEKQ